MSLRISTRLFLGLSAMGVVVALITMLASRYSFSRGFLGYLNDQSVAQLRTLVPRFEAAYNKYGDWRVFHENHPLWYEYIQPAYIYRVGPPLPLQTVLAEKPPAVVLTGLFNRLALLDANLERMVGDPEVTPQSPRVPIRVGGRTVGWLAVAPFESVSGPADLRFQHEQYLAMWVIAAAAILLAALAAGLLSRPLAQPLRRIAAAMHRLAAGDYSQRLAVTSHDEVGQLASDFNELADALTSHEQARRAFMADVSHELRTPLTVLRGLADAIEDGVRKPTRDTLLSMKTEVLTLSKLVDDLYDLSLSDRGALAYRKSTTDLGELLRLTIDAFRDRLTARCLTLDVLIPEQPVLIEADETRLNQLFNNILENCVRYVDFGGRVHIQLQVSASQVTIGIEDSAPGVPEPSLQHLFERFYRADPSRSRATGGAGLGLSICKNIVDAHGGTIRAGRSMLGGLSVQIILPLDRCGPLQTLADQPESHALI